MKWLALIILAGCVFSDPEPLAPAPWSPGSRVPMRVQVQAASAIAIGRITRIAANWEYDDPCGIISRLTGRCDGTRAYDVEITGAKVWYPMVFVPHNDWNPLHVGLEGVFLLHEVWATKFQQCRQQAGLTSAACTQTGSVTLAILDTLDVFPRSDSARVFALRQ